MRDLISSLEASRRDDSNGMRRSPNGVTDPELRDREVRWRAPFRATATVRRPYGRPYSRPYSSVRTMVLGLSAHFGSGGRFRVFGFGRARGYTRDIELGRAHSVKSSLPSRSRCELSSLAP